jgi:hypothetical protein
MSLSIAQTIINQFLTEENALTYSKQQDKMVWVSDLIDRPISSMIVDLLDNEFYIYCLDRPYLAQNL